MPTYPRPARVGQGHRIILEPWDKFPANLTVYQNAWDIYNIYRLSSTYREYLSPDFPKLEEYLITSFSTNKGLYTM